MLLDDRRAGRALLALGGVALLAFLALFLLRAPERAPGPVGPAPEAGPVPPGGNPAPPAPPTPPPSPPVSPKKLDVGKMTLKVMEMFVLHGTVRGPDGKTPVPGATIEVVPRAGRREHRRADHQGAFTWMSEEPTPAAVVWAFAPGVGLGHLFVQGAQGQVSDQDLVLAAFRPLPVRVESGKHEGVGGARVEASPTGDDMPVLPGTAWGGTTNDGGECTLGVPPGIPLRILAHRGALTGEVTAVVEPVPAEAKPLVIVLEEKTRAGR